MLFRSAFSTVLLLMSSVALHWFFLVILCLSVYVCSRQQCLQPAVDPACLLYCPLIEQVYIVSLIFIHCDSDHYIFCKIVIISEHMQMN